MDNIGTKKIETERLILRRFTLEDANDMYQNWATDPEVTRYVTWDVHKNVNETKELLKNWVKSYTSDFIYKWVVELKSTGDIIGSIDLVNSSMIDKTGEIGYCYGSKWWGKGYATEALEAVLHYLFDVVGFELIEARYRSDNPASGKVMEKAGMKYETKLCSRFYNVITKKRADLLYYSLTKEEYK